MTRHAPLELEGFLPYRLSILTNRISQSIAREYQERFGLTATEWRIIAVLARHDGEDLVAISRALARLVAAGRVLRRTHHGDKRRSMLRLSAAGWKVHDAVAPRARAHERNVLGRLTEEERAWLDRILDKLSASG